MSRNSIDLEVKATYAGEDVEFSYNVTTESLDDLKERAAEEWNSVHFDEAEAIAEAEEREAREASADDVVLEVKDWGDTPEKLRDIDGDSEFFEFCDEFSRSNYDVEVFAAAYECDVAFSDVDEAYQGAHDDDEAFARETAEGLGYINRDARWPYTCIDWEHAAKELMMDYCSDNGHYFRNL